MRFRIARKSPRPLRRTLRSFGRPRPDQLSHGFRYLHPLLEFVLIARGPCRVGKLASSYLGLSGIFGDDLLSSLPYFKISSLLSHAMYPTCDFKRIPSSGCPRILNLHSATLDAFGPNHFFAFWLRWGQPGQQQGRRMPSLSWVTRRSTCSFLVSSLLTIVTQQIHSFLASGVMSSQAASALVSERKAFRRSSGKSWTTPAEMVFGAMSFFPGQMPVLALLSALQTVHSSLGS